MEKPDFTNPFVAPEGETNECRKWREAHANSTRTLALAKIGAKYILAFADESKPLPKPSEIFEMVSLDQGDADEVEQALIAEENWSDEVVGREIDETKDGWEDQWNAEKGARDGYTSADVLGPDGKHYKPSFGAALLRPKHKREG